MITKISFSRKNLVRIGRILYLIKNVFVIMR